MLIHICCSVDSHYFLQKIQNDFPNEELVGFFYDPNIHPYSEYKLRLLDVQHSCDILGIELLEGPYDIETWLKFVKGLEQEPEKGDRCTVCFDRRLDVSAKKALELGHNKFTTTLLISPKKSQEKLEIIGKDLSIKYNLEFIFKDYRIGNGVELQGKEVKKNNLYRQNYCGCLFGLIPQRQSQDKLLDEMMNPIGNQTLPQSIEERLEFYEQRNRLYNDDVDYKIVKERFLNYRILSGSVKIKKVAIPSYFLGYSTLRTKKVSGSIDYVYNNLHFLNKDEVKILSLEQFNILANTKYKNVHELIYKPLRFSNEVGLRKSLVANEFDLSCIIVLDEIPLSKIEIFLDSKFYDDVRERIIYL
ncbi:MAG TPA: epoxyqueuosine reductase QueH [Arcobacter sp.]|nr:epoxyqueuosine reductase QueH [Arcobacter sp.]